MNQSVISFASVAARNAAIPAPLEGQLVWLEDSNKYVYYTGSAWTDLIVPASSGNAIINGAFEFWQRGTTTSSSGYLADRWSGFFSSGTVTNSRQSFTPGNAPVTGYESAFFYRTVVSGQSGTGAINLVSQKIEDVRTFAGQTVTFSFWAKAASGTPKIAMDLFQDFGTGGAPSAGASTPLSAVTISTSWVRYSATVTLPSINGKTIGTNNNSSLELVLWSSAGTEFTTRSSAIGIQANTFDIWGIQLESGSTLTPFKRNANSIQGELAACQRYYQRVLWAGGGEMSATTSGNSVAMSSLLPVEMRATPSASTTMTNANYGAGNWTFVQSGISTSSKSGTVVIGIAARVQQFTAFFTGATYSPVANGWQNLASGTIFIELSAEL
jgi:hypothetical protein